MVRQKELQLLQNEKLQEQKFDAIIKQQEQVIARLQHQMEEAVVKNLQNDLNQDEIEDLLKEVQQLQTQVNQAQYGLVQEVS